MPRTDNEIKITPPVLDRLLDYDPEQSREPAISRSRSLRDFKLAVRRDLEWLLNTRHGFDIAQLGPGELQKSLVAYGLPDFTGVSLKSPADQAKLRRTIETAIATFEPRLQDVVVTLEEGRRGDRAVRFRIDARLRIEPAPEAVTFDSTLYLDTGQYSVEGE